MKVIGGYFELSLNDFESVFHDDAYAFNSGRNALEYVLRVNNYQKVFLPYYTCEVVLDPILKIGLEYEFYHIDDNLMPEINSLSPGEAIIINNYFGVMDKAITSLHLKFSDSIIVDNSQAFYNKLPLYTNSFYSPRKFFGLPDGGFAYTTKSDGFYMSLEQSKSYMLMDHLTKRIDVGAEEAYENFKVNDKALEGAPMKRMSNLSLKLLKNINYEIVKEQRKKNFEFLHERLAEHNELSNIINEGSFKCAMIYPFLKKGNEQVRKYLIRNKIFSATYWPGVINWIDKENSWEVYLQKNLLAIPIDQRYDVRDMSVILNCLND